MDYEQRFFRTSHWFLHEHRRHHWGWSHSKNQKDEERRTGKVPEWNEWMVRHRSSVLRFTFEFECEDMWKDKNYGKEDWNISRKDLWTSLCITWCRYGKDVWRALLLLCYDFWWTKMYEPCRWKIWWLCPM